MKKLDQRISWLLHFIIQIIKFKLQKSLFYIIVIYSIKYSQIITSPQFRKSSWFYDNKVWSTISTKITGGVSECKLVIRRSDDNYSLNGLFSKLNQHLDIYKYMVSFAPFANEYLNTVTSSLKINKVSTASLIYILLQGKNSHSNNVKAKIQLDIQFQKLKYIFILYRSYIEWHQQSSSTVSQAGTRSYWKWFSTWHCAQHT